MIKKTNRGDLYSSLKEVKRNIEPLRYTFHTGVIEQGSYHDGGKSTTTIAELVGFKGKKKITITISRDTP